MDARPPGPPSAHEILERSFEGEADFWHVRNFLAAHHERAAPGHLWDVRMWDGNYHCDHTPWGDTDRGDRTRLFEAPDGQVVAALLSEGTGEIHMQVHPEARHLEPHLLERGESIASQFGEKEATVLLWDDDVHRKAMLERFGYRPSDEWACLYRTDLAARETTPPRVPEGYRIRATKDDPEEAHRLARLLNDAFDRDRHHAGEIHGLWRNAPSYRRDLDLVAESTAGELASYVGVCWDDDNRKAIFEPVCTHPDHRRRGLARALMLEGFHRARAHGATAVDVSTGDEDPAHALYQSVGFEHRYLSRFWKKPL